MAPESRKTVVVVSPTGTPPRPIAGATFSSRSFSQQEMACWRNSRGRLCSATTDSAESKLSIPGDDDDDIEEESNLSGSASRGSGDASHSAIDGFNAPLKRAAGGEGHGHRVDPAARAESVVTRALAAEEILDRMELPSSEVRPDGESYNIVLRAWNGVVISLSAPEGCPVTGMTALEATERAERLLHRMEGEGDNSSSRHHPPTAESYDLVADALVHCRAAGAAEKIEALLARMVERGIRPDARTYEALIDAWAASPFRHAAQRAEGALHQVEDMYLREMQQQQQQSASGDGAGESEVVNDAGKANRHSGGGNLRPTMHMYKSVLRAWSRHEDRHEAARRSDDLLRHMDGLRTPSGTDGHRVRIIDFPPDTPCYTAVIDAWRNSDADEGAAMAQGAFDRLERAGLRPYANTYTSVLQAWSKRAKFDDGAPLRAEELLERMEAYSRIGEDTDGDDDDRSRHQQQAHVAYRPNVITYTSVINAWARCSRDAEKATKALRLLRRMNELVAKGEEQVRPNLYTYNSAINACATCHGADSSQQRQALKIAFAVLKALDLAGAGKDVAAEKPNHITYGTLLKAAANLLPMGEARADVVRATFSRCAKEGQVDEGVIKQFRLSADRELFYEILGEAARGRNFRHGEVDMSALPSEWTRNVQK